MPHLHDVLFQHLYGTNYYARLQHTLLCPSLLKCTSVKATVRANTAWHISIYFYSSNHYGNKRTNQSTTGNCSSLVYHWRKWQHKPCFWTSNWHKMLPPGQVPKASGFTWLRNGSLFLFPLREVGVKIKKKVTGAWQQLYLFWKGSQQHPSFFSLLLANRFGCCEFWNLWCFWPSLHHISWYWSQVENSSLCKIFFFPFSFLEHILASLPHHFHTILHSKKD